jgi:hypothetical protein
MNTFEQLKKSDYFHPSIEFKFKFFTEGEVYYEFVSELDGYRIQISFFVDSIYACHQSHTLDYFEEEEVRCFNYEISTIKRSVVEKTSNYSDNFNLEDDELIIITK